jgi:hypothetical protein
MDGEKKGVGRGGMSYWEVIFRWGYISYVVVGNAPRMASSALKSKLTQMRDDIKSARATGTWNKEAKVALTKID